MLTVLISDDEPLTLRGIRDGIPWKDLGLDTVLTARNGINALEVLDGREPDILLTDVYMPRMDGIALAKKIRAQFPQCTILFLTGYTKEAYLRSAIEVKAEQYINKPVNMEKLYEILDGVVEKKQEQLRIKQQQEQSHRVTLGIMLSRTSISSRELEKAIKAADLGIIYGKPFCCLGFHIPLGDDSSRGKGEINFQKIQTGINDIFQGRGFIPLSYIDQENRIICFMFFMNANQNKEAVRSLICSYRKNLPAECAIALSETGLTLEASSRVYNEVREGLETSFYLGVSPILENPGQVPNNAGSTGINADNLKDAIINGQYTNAMLLLQTLQNDLTEAMPPVFYAKSLLQEILNLLKNQRERSAASPEPASDEGASFMNISTIDGCIGIVAEKINDQVTGHESGNLLAKRAQVIIKHELGNTNLSITFLTDKMNITAPYLCYLFKRHFKETINHYINRLRIEKAKNILASTQLKINEIAELCGFSGVNYFTRTFKKTAGILPTQYRREKQ